mgnify:CR=1 FL=1
MGLGGVQRVQKFVKYLPLFGWRPIVVTVKDVKYYGRDESLLRELPPEALVYRTGSYDPLRVAHRMGVQSGTVKTGEGIRKFAKWVLFPDNQIPWVPFAVQCAKDIIREHQIDALFSTYPPGSAHLAGYMVHRSSGIPWVADYRDSWLGGEFNRPASDIHYAMMKILNLKFTRHANHITAVTNHIAGQLSDLRGYDGDTSVISNGYDPEDFQGLDEPPPDGRFTLTYCGTLNKARHPGPLLKGIRHLLDRYPDLSDNLHLKLIGASIDLDVDGLIDYYRLPHVVTRLGYLPHREALAHLAASDAVLLLVTSEHCRASGVPTGKFYECAATGRPILAITPDGSGLTWLRKAGRGIIVSPGDTGGISDVIESWIRQHVEGILPVYGVAGTEVFNRPNLTGQLARILDHVSNT